MLLASRDVRFGELQTCAVSLWLKTGAFCRRHVFVGCGVSRSLTRRVLPCVLRHAPLVFRGCVHVGRFGLLRTSLATGMACVITAWNLSSSSRRRAISVGMLCHRSSICCCGAALAHAHTVMYTPSPRPILTVWLTDRFVRACERRRLSLRGSGTTKFLNA